MDTNAMKLRLERKLARQSEAVKTTDDEIAVLETLALPPAALAQVRNKRVRQYQAFQATATILEAINTATKTKRTK